jgi:hypothetical protein
MKKSEKNELRRLRAVQLFLKRHTSVYVGYTALERASDKLNELLDDLEAVQVLQTKGSTAITTERNQYRSTLEELMRNGFSHLLQVAQDNELDGLRRFATVSPTQLRRLKPEELVAKGMLLLSELELHEVSLEEGGFSLDDRAAFSDALNLYEEWMQAPRETIEVRKVATTAVPSLLLKGRRLVRGQMAGFVERFRVSAPTFYAEFQEARKLKRVAVSHEEGAGDVAAAA